VVVYDTETTGLDVLKDEPVQISAIRLNAKGEIVDTLDVFALPTVPISKGAYDTHGFDEAYIRTRGGLSQKEALEKFAQFCKGATLVGHNSSRFDLPLLRRRYKAHGLPPLDIKGEYDTLTLAKLFLPTLKNHKLSTLCERFSLVNVRAHDALSDITATAGVLGALLTEFVLPTAKERAQAVEKYAPLFSKLNAFVEEVRSKIHDERGERLAEILAYAVEVMRVESVYKGVGDAQAMETLKEQLAEAEARDGTDKEGVLQKFLAEASLSGSPLDARVTGAKRVPIVTVHQAKGCEFDTVIIVGADDGNFPAFVSKKEKDLEEEKRVFFVALTRAKKSVIMTRALYKYSKPLSPTRYFYKIPQECVETNAEWNEK
jgi:DNA helicase-2/ATP-dependent DNA helicase PcrA